MRRNTSILLAIILVLTILAPIGVFPTSSMKATFSTKPMIAAGSYHSLALANNGKILGWGYNILYQYMPPAYPK